MNADVQRLSEFQPDGRVHSYDQSYERSHPPRPIPATSFPSANHITESQCAARCRRRDAYIVPRGARALAPVSPERIQRLRKHLLDALRALRTMRKPGGGTTPPAELTGFVARVARTACTLCEGWCCKGGGEHAYLDERTLARLCGTTPGLSARAILRLYLGRVQQLFLWRPPDIRDAWRRHPPPCGSSPEQAHA